MDFSAFYGAGQMVRSGLGSNLYDLATQADFQRRVPAEEPAVVNFYLRPPFEVLLFLPLTLFSYRVAYTVWTIANLCVLVAVAFWIAADTNVTTAVSQLARLRADTGLLLAIFLTFSPMTTNLLLGEDSILILLCYTVAFLLLKRGAGFSAGCVLACGLFKFNLIVPFVAVLILRRKWSVIKGFVLAAATLLLVSIAVSGTGFLYSYPRSIFFDRTFHQVMENPSYSPNLHGISHMILQKNIMGLTPMVILVASMAVILWAARNWRDDRLGFSFSGGVLASVLASYHLYNYDLTLLLLPASIICGELACQGRLFSSGKGFMAALTMLFVPPVHFFLVTHGIYALMCIPIIFLFVFVLRLLRDREHKEKTA